MGAWIEILVNPACVNAISVAPLVGAWIEMPICLLYLHNRQVAPLVGAWIEIDVQRYSRRARTVAPLVGAWIEIAQIGSSGDYAQSLLSWERGLKWQKKWQQLMILSRSSRGSVD